MITDFHTHIFPDKIADAAVDKLSHAAHIIPHTDARAHSLLVSMQRAGIGRSVVLPVATSARQIEKLNDAAARLNESYEPASSEPHSPVLFSFGAMHPEYENWYAELSRIRDLGLIGFKIHPVYQGTDIDDISYLRILSRAAELGLTVVTHAGLDIGFPGVVHCSPQMCRHVIDEVGDFSFILAHMGGWRNWDDVIEHLADTGAMIDTAFSYGSIEPLADGYWDEQDTDMLTAEALTRIIRAFGAERVLFGTDSPWADQTKSLEFIRRLPLEPAELGQILSGNAERLLGL